MPWFEGGGGWGECLVVGMGRVLRGGGGGGE